jgi:hypothetical protein
MRYVTASVSLDATPEHVWQILTDTDGHSAWNPFITKMAGTLAVGTKLDIRIVPPGGKAMAFYPTVTEVDAPHRLAWVGHLGIRGLFDGAHAFTLTPTPDGRTQLEQSETFTGVLVWISRGLLAKTRAGFEAMHEALSAHIVASRHVKEVQVEEGAISSTLQP